MKRLPEEMVKERQRDMKEGEEEVLRIVRDKMVMNSSAQVMGEARQLEIISQFHSRLGFVKYEHLMKHKRGVLIKELCEQRKKRG